MVNDDLLEHEKSIAEILNRLVSLCKESGLKYIAKKGEQALENYSNSRK